MKKNYDNEKPVEIVRDKGKHSTETRIFARKIREVYCVQKGCEFYKKHAAQGVCYGKSDRVEEAYFARVEGLAADLLKEIKASNKGTKDYIRALESSLFCAWMNYEFTLDECIRLRGQDALMKVKRGGWK